MVSHRSVIASASASMLPLILICAGFFFLFQDSGWTINFTYSWSFYWPVVMILIGLTIALRRSD